MHEKSFSPAGNGRLTPSPYRTGLVRLPSKQTSVVCLLDDDPSVLKAASRLLDSAGWNVEPFNDPIAFLEVRYDPPPPVGSDRHRDAGHERTGSANAATKCFALNPGHHSDQQRRSISTFESDEIGSCGLFPQVRRERKATRRNSICHERKLVSTNPGLRNAGSRQDLLAGPGCA